MHELFIELCRVINCPMDYVANVLNQFKELGITELINDGSVEFMGEIRLLGKGQNSFVFKCSLKDLIGHYACKVRRHDSPRPSLTNEAHNLKLANSVNVGPHLIRFTNDVLVMEYARGVTLHRYINTAGPGEVKFVVRELLNQGFRLDSIGLIHGELSRLSEHVIVGDRVYIIDFESASRSARSITNVTQLISALILGKGAIQRRVRELLNVGDTGELVKLLRLYKLNISHETFSSILKLLNLEPQ